MLGETFTGSITVYRAGPPKRVDKAAMISKHPQDLGLRPVVLCERTVMKMTMESSMREKTPL